MFGARKTHKKPVYVQRITFGGHYGAVIVVQPVTVEFPSYIVHFNNRVDIREVTRGDHLLIINVISDTLILIKKESKQIGYFIKKTQPSKKLSIVNFYPPKFFQRGTHVEQFLFQTNYVGFCGLI